ncbi:hypothetical protein CaCOL14_000335 [Colletotrichum acutatum]
MKTSMLSLIILLPRAFAQYQPPFLCVSSPAIPIEAGATNVTATIEDPLNRRCEATVYFADPNFLPISYSFEAKCPDRKINNFVMPLGAPNGEAHITWHCAGQVPSCTRAMITGGRGDPSLPLQNQGKVGCVSQSVLTRTTLATVTRSSTTIIETVPALITSITTNFVVEATTTTSNGDTASGTSTTSVTVGTPATDSPGNTAPGPPGTTAAETTLATNTGAAGGKGSSTSQTAALPEPTSVSDPLATFYTNTASDPTTSLTTTAALTAVVSTLTVMQTVTAPCSADV